MLVSILNMDNKLLALIQRRARCSFLDKIMPAITSLGTCGLIWGIVVVIFLRIRVYRRAGLVLFVTLAICALLTNLVLKPLVARPRPCHVTPEVPLLIPCPMDYSFPSGHTMSSFAAAFIIACTLPHLGVFVFLLAATIAYSRLYLFVHYPSDVLAGSLIGTAISIMMMLIFFH
ncbi:phosphatase PAP2 family protein [Caproiciproducens sp. LBM24188]|jgi:undecaprenyl-diphosphatase|nr:phosphatase PAP2 family protein [Oscillospiraceae bacterium]